MSTDDRTAGADQVGADRARPIDTGFVVVRLPDAPANDSFDDLVELAKTRGPAELSELLDRFRIRSAGRLVTVATPGELREQEQSGSDSPFYRAESLTQYWRIDLRDRAEVIPKLVKRLRALESVESAYAEPRMVVPEINEEKSRSDKRAGSTGPVAQAYAASATLVYAQGYHDPAPVGVDVLDAWTRRGGTGDQIGIVDLELGWQLDHVELAHLGVTTTIVGDQLASDAGHGTSVLGVLVAKSDGAGVSGMIPTPRSVGVASHYDKALGTDFHVANAVKKANDAMQTGDILLVEVQTVAGEPIEVDPAAATAIRTVCTQNKIVVVAAGNGKRKLDTMRNLDNARPFKPGTTTYDTGSIFVGAGRAELIDLRPDKPTYGHERQSDSNHGARVDCYAWGTLVATCGWIGDLRASAVARTEYTNYFSGTSSASAIVAGAAVLVQGMHKAAKGSLLDPQALRRLFRDRTLGTPQVKPAKSIGSMPDLKKIFTWITSS